MQPRDFVAEPRDGGYIITRVVDENGGREQFEETVYTEADLLKRLFELRELGDTYVLRTGNTLDLID